MDSFRMDHLHKPVALASVPFLVLGLALTFSVLTVRAATKARVYYVATNGNDAWSGTARQPNRRRTDGPFATVARAAAAVRELKQSQGGALAQPVTVHLRGGTYALAEPIRFTPADSGTAACPVEYAAFKDETPVLSGGRRITGWKPVTVQGRTLWAADLPEVRAGAWSFHQLWVDGERRYRARHPNRGYLKVAELIGVKEDAPWTEGVLCFRFHPGDLKAWPSVAEAEVRVMNRWVESHLPVAGVDEAERVVRFGKRSVFKLEPGDLYYIENALELLDAPGEWYLDRAAGTLYYLPMPSEDLSRAVVIAPVLTQVLRLEGQPEHGAFVEHLRFRGLTFAHTEWYFPTGFVAGEDKPTVWPPPDPRVGGFVQAAIGVPGGVRGEGVRSTVFDQCRFMNLGTYALDLRRGCQSNHVSHCALSDLAAGGIRIGDTAIRDNPGEVTCANEVSDCHIRDGGRIFHSGIGVWIGQSPANVLRHNHIHDFYYTGVSVGWTWGYGRALATNTVVEYNLVHHIGKTSDGDGPILSDMAGIYTLGLHEGSVIRNNIWHDIAGLRYGGWGIYFDEGTTRILAENNLVYRTTHGGFHQHYGRENTVRNNIFVDARDFQVQRSRAEDHVSFTFENNLVSWHRGKLLDGKFEDSKYLFRSNVYWHAGGGEVRFGKWSFDEWQKRGQDAGSQIADPEFIAPEKDDYALAPDSPAFRSGFRALDLRRVGIRPKAKP